jgi:acyl-CoA synthetase (AMP-forming)/AMP-acid ligase II
LSAALADIVRTQAARQPEAEALSCGTRRLTWAQLDEHSSRVAGALIGAGARRGARVAVLSRNNAEFFEVAFGAAKAGLVTAPLNWRLAAPELAAILADLEPTVLFADRESAELLPAATRETAILYEDGYQAWRDRAPGDDPHVAVDPDDPVYMLYSSGTTGLPKGIVLTHANLALSERMAREAFRMDEGTVHMCPGPQFHIAGAGTGLMAMFTGGRTVVIRDVVPELLLQTIGAEGVTHAFMVPAVIGMVIDSPALAPTDVSSLRQVSYGAAPISEALLRRAIDALGCDFLGVYGMTETAGTAVTLDPEDHVPELLRSVGNPLPWMELKVADLASGQVAAPGVVGEIMIRSGGVTPGYWRQPEVTAATITADGWLHTGDGAYRDERGYVFLADRIKDMIISGGENVYPAEVENALAEHPAIAEVAVIGVPHERWGETVKAVVVPRAEARPDAEEIRSFARAHLAGYKCPTSVELLAELPRNPSGKVLKRLLRERYAPALVGLVRRWAVDWLGAGDESAAREVLAEDYTLCIGSHRFEDRDAYMQATIDGLLDPFPGVQAAIHDLVCSGSHAAVDLTLHDEHVAWGVVALFELGGDRIVRGWAAEDYLARRRQRAEGVRDALRPAMAAPWSTPAVAPDPAAEARARERLDGAQIDLLFSAGERVAYHGVWHHAGEPPLPFAGIDEHVISDLLGQRRAASAGGSVR